MPTRPLPKVLALQPTGSRGGWATAGQAALWGRSGSGPALFAIVEAVLGRGTCPGPLAVGAGAALAMELRQAAQCTQTELW